MKSLGVLATGALTFSLLTLTLAGCADPERRLVVELVPNPEVNTSEQVAAVINSLDVVLDAEGGFEALDASEGDTWGVYEVTDFDSDGLLELVLTRPGDDALDSFALTPGHQGARMLRITALGVDIGQTLAALGATNTAFSDELTTSCQVPFNLLPERRPLRVISMIPPTGSQDLEPPIEGLTIQLGGEVLDTALEGRVHLRAVSVDLELEPGLAVSYVQTGMGRLTNLRFQDCILGPGEYTIVVDTEVCTTSGQCLDQHLSMDGVQPFEGVIHVRGEPEPPDCAVVGVLSQTCPAEECPEGFVCEDGACVEATDVETGGNPPSASEECDPQLCTPPLYVCDGEVCVPDCRVYGLCTDLTMVCDQRTGLCE